MVSRDEHNDQPLFPEDIISSEEGCVGGGEIQGITDLSKAQLPKEIVTPLDMSGALLQFMYRLRGPSNLPSLLICKRKKIVQRSAYVLNEGRLGSPRLCEAHIRK